MVNSVFKSQHAFTLIELSVVLVIIGLIVGGILTGRDLIAAAGVRAQITQIEKYRHAVNTFRGKYNYLPGDIPDPDASNFGFVARSTWAGLPYGNGILEGFTAYPPFSNNIVGFASTAGEPLVFWRDMATAKIINEGPFLSNNTSGVNSSLSPWTMVPAAKLGQEAADIQGEVLRSPSSVRRG